MDRDAAQRALEARLDATPIDQGLTWMLNASISTFELRMGQLRTIVARYERELHDSPDVRRAQARLGRKRCAVVESAVAAFEAGLQEIADEAELFEDEDEAPRHLSNQPEIAALGAYLFAGDDRLAQLSSALVAATAQDDEALSYAQALLTLHQEQAKPPAYLDACLPAAVSDFEELLASLLRIGQYLQPKALNAMSRTVTLQEIEERGGADGARLFAFDEVARTLIKDGPAEWQKRLTKWPGIDPTSLIGDWASVQEIFHRRNAIVHSGGRADTHYVDRVSKVLTDHAQLGEHLPSTAAYLLRAFDQLTCLGMGLAILWLRKLRPSAAPADDRADRLVIAMLENERWSDVNALAGAFLDLGVGDAGLLQVNRWMAQREVAGTADAIAADVTAWIPPDGDIRWRIASAALLQNVSAVKVALREAEQAGEHISGYASWPLLRMLRRRDPSLAVLLDRPAVGRAGRPRRRRK